MLGEEIETDPIAQALSISITGQWWNILPKYYNKLWTKLHSNIPLAIYTLQNVLETHMYYLIHKIQAYLFHQQTKNFTKKVIQ